MIWKPNGEAMMPEISPGCSRQPALSNGVTYAPRGAAFMTPPVCWLARSSVFCRASAAKSAPARARARIPATFRCAALRSPGLACGATFTSTCWNTRTASESVPVYTLSIAAGENVVRRAISVSCQRLPSASVISGHITSATAAESVLRTPVTTALPNS